MLQIVKRTLIICGIFCLVDMTTNDANIQTKLSNAFVRTNDLA